MKCAVCGDEHDELDDPDNNLLTEDLCMVDGEDYFIRGVLEIPLVERDDYFGWGVWVSEKKENFETCRDHFDTDAIGPFFGWLAAEIDYVPETTLNPPSSVKFVGGGT